MTATTRPLSDLGQAGPEWLACALTANGYLTQGRVTHVIRNVWKRSFYSLVARLKVGYSTDARWKDGHAPPVAMILKFPRPDRLGKRLALYSRREFEFYRFVAPRMAQAPAAQCYDTAFDATSGGYHFLMEDISATHTHSRNPVPPSTPDCERIVECLARLHAAWWNDARLGTDFGKPFLDEQGSKRIISIAPHTHRLLAFLGDRASASRRKVLLDLCAAVPELLQRQAAGPLTITHGDAHGENFLFAPGSTDCRLIDWECWEVGPATDDLAYMMAVRWFAQRRQLLEQKLLRRYHEALVAAGVADYSWDSCWSDYRLSVIKLIARPVFEWSYGVVPERWWNDLERVLTAYEDLGCTDIMAQLKAQREG